MELIRRLRYIGYLDRIGIIERESGEVFEKLIDHLASSRDWSRVSAVVAASESDRGLKRVSTASAKKSAKKSSKKSRKAKTALPEVDEVITEPVKLYYVIDRRDFLERAKSVYASYA
jgi:hypothetical protein